jgi:hypothetical protein
MDETDETVAFDQDGWIDAIRRAMLLAGQPVPVTELPVVESVDLSDLPAIGNGGSFTVTSTTTMGD